MGQVSIYEDNVTIMKWKENIRLPVCVTRDDIVMSARVRGKDIKKHEVIVHYDLQIGGIIQSDAWLASYRSARKRLENVIETLSQCDRLL
jgi:hypothetical protein